MKTPRTALVLGATGGAGGAIAAALIQAGWAVRGLVRDTERSGLASAIGWHKGDAMKATDVAQAARGVEVIVHAVNPPGYRNWDTLVLPMLDSTIAAAQKNGARIVLPGTVYNFGPDAPALLGEDAPQRPLTRKGAIRVQMEQRLQAAADDGVRVLILRCGDFFGPRAGNSWFSAIVKSDKRLRSVSYPGSRDLPHAWAYLPDVGTTVAKLLDRETTLAPFETFHFGGHWVDGRSMLQAIRKAAANPTLPLRPFPWWLVALASPFVTTLREVREMRYLWRQPLQLDNRKLVALLDEEPHTPLQDAVAQTLGGTRCR